MHSGAPATVFVEAHLAEMVEFGFDRPMIAGQGEVMFWRGFFGRQAGDYPDLRLTT